MKWFKKHPKLRIVIIALSFILGIVLTLIGWRAKPNVTALCVMLGGILCLLLSLWVYNLAFSEE